jgi:PKD repeat protein
MWFSPMQEATGRSYVRGMDVRRRSTERSGPRTGFARLIGAVTIVASGLTFSSPPVVAQISPAASRPVVSVDLGSTGFAPSTVIAVPGQQIEFTNTSGTEQRIVGGAVATPTFDSGAIPDGGRFVAAFDTGVQLGIQTTADPPFTGRLLITEPGLSGDHAAPARSAIPDLAPPPTLASDLSPHPDYGRPTSRTRLLVLPAATATIGQVNDALAAVGASIVAGMPRLHTIEVAIADTGDLTTLLATLTSLRAAPGIEDVAPEWEVGFDVRPAATNLGDPEDQLWSSTQPLDAMRGQWGLRAIRAAQAWNSLPTARESAIDRQAQVDTVVLDTTFGPHPDIEFASREGNQPDNHAIVDAGIIGASFANAAGTGRTEGVVGVDPLSKLHGVEFWYTDVDTPVAPGEKRVATIGDASGSFNEVFREKRPGGKFPRLGVISASFGMATFGGKLTKAWVTAVGTRRCNPGVADDPYGGVGGSQACTPINQDVFRRDLASVATVYAQQVLSAAADLDIVIVKSAGNANDEFCVNGFQILACPNAAGQTQLELPAAVTNEFIQARTTLGGSTPPPLLVVGASGPTGAGASVGTPVTFSQGGPGVDLVAPGQQILSTSINQLDLDPDTVQSGSASGAYYERMSGTSQATPHVAAVAAYLRSMFALNAQQTVAAIRHGTTTVPFNGTLDPTAPQLDMWKTVAYEARGRLALADQNDASVDGNERVQRTINDAPGAALDWVPTDSLNARLGPRRADPDATVDMKDVRSFRDAWLQTCVDGSWSQIGPLITSPACPISTNVALDGSAQSWKRDGNLDGCVNPGVDGFGNSPCGDPLPTGAFVYHGEARDNRWDLNGDGYLAPSVAATVPFDSSNQFSQVGTSMTDLDVLATLLTPTSTFEGWTLAGLRSGGLRDLMTSADVQVRFDRFGDNGAPFTGTVDVFVDYGSGRLVRSNYYVHSGSNQLMLTVPVTATGAPLKVWVVGGARRSPVIEIAKALPGQDIVVAPRAAELKVTLGASQLVPSSSTMVTVELDQASLGLNNDQNIVGDVTLTVNGLAPDAPVLARTTVPLDENGVATTTLTAGATTGVGSVRAELTLPTGQTTSGTAPVEVVPGITIRYAHRSTVRSYTYGEAGTTRWADPERPDCARIPVVCIDDLRVRTSPGATPFEVTRRGTLTLRASGFTVTEQVDGGVGQVTYDYTWTDIDASTGTASQTFSFSPRASERNRYVDEPVDATFWLNENRARLDGIQALSSLGYVTDLSSSRAPFASPDTRAVTLPRQFLLAPDDTGGNLYIGDSNRPVRFTRATSSAAWGPFTACARRTVDLSDTPGYELGTTDPWAPGSTKVERDRVYDPGDIPQPVQRAELVFVTGFSATLTTDGSEPAEPVLLPCEGVNPPTASFTISDARGAPLADGGVVREGEVVRFFDTSTDPDDDIVERAWTFGDGRRSTATDPVIGGYADDGLYTVTLTVTDLDGNTNTSSTELRVINQNPTIEAVVPITTVTAGERAKVQFVIDDAGRTDRRALKVQISGAPTSIATAVREAGLVTVDVGVLTADTTIQAAVIDPANAYSPWASVRVVVTPEPVPPPPCPGGPMCPPPPVSARLDAPLDAQERTLFNMITAARRTAGLPALSVSAELNAVANTSARANTSGASVDLRAAVAASGYPSASTVRLAITGDDSGTVAATLSAHMLSLVTDPSVQMLGIARVGLDGDTDTYAIVVGDVLDTDVTPPPRGTAPTLSVTFSATGLSEGVTVAPTITAGDVDDDLTAIDIDWGDGTIGGRSHRFRDDGTFTVTVVALDEQLNRTISTTTVVVANSPPELDLSVLGADGGQPAVGEDATLNISVLDWAEADRPLTLTVSSTMPGISFDGPVTGDRALRFRPTSAGTFTVTATLTDPDGGTAGPPTSTAMPFSFTVLGAPSAPSAPANVTVPAAPCSAGVTLRAQAADFLGLVNTYRSTQGLTTPLVIDPALQAAAQAHLEDLIATRSFSHRGTGNSTPESRARVQGYLGAVGENLIVGTPSADTALRGWRMSPPHHANLLRPWTATGVAVGNSAFGPLWVQVFGDTATCAGTAPPVTSTVLVPQPARSGAPQIGVLPWPEPGGLEVAVAAVVPAAATPATPALPSQVAPTTTVPDVRVLAYTIDRTTAETGQLVRVTNRSRTAGTPVAARVLLPGSGNVVAQPDATVSLSWFEPGSGAAAVSVRSMTWTDDITLSTSVALTGSALPPLITITTTPSTVPQGGSVSVVARVTDPGGSPLPGRTVRVEAASALATGVTDDTGIARIALVLDLPAGAHQIGAAVVDDAGIPVSIAAPRDVTVTAHVAPVALTTGPYAVNLGDTVEFDASTSAATAPATIASAVWDLDDDGSFGDLSALTASMPFPQVEQLVCAGECSTGRSYPVAVRVADSTGATATTSTTVRFARDFGLMVGPQTQTIRPGEQTTFTVEAVTTSGFSEPIDLTTVGLPAGVTARFAPTRILPGQSAVLTVDLAPSLTGVDEVALTVRGTSTGGTIRDVSPKVSVVFGLVPVCYGTVTGTVRDVRTGLPMPGATVWSSALGTTTTTGDDGTYRFDGLAMQYNNQSGTSYFSVVKDGYWQQASHVTYRCGQPQPWNVELLDIRQVSIRWNVREGARDPSRPSTLIPTAGIPAGVEITPASRPRQPLGDDGSVLVTYDLSSGNNPIYVYASATAPGYVDTQSASIRLDNTMVGAEPLVQSVLLPRPCSASILRGKIVGPEGQPAPGATASIDGTVYQGDDLGEFDVNRSFTLPGNTARYLSMGADPTDAQYATGWRGTSTGVYLQECDNSLALVRLQLTRVAPPAPPPPIATVVTGRITDVETGDPIANASVLTNGQNWVATDADGRYRSQFNADGPLGRAMSITVYATASTHYGSNSPSTSVEVGTAVEIDVALLRVRTGAVDGVVRDLATGLPIPGAQVQHPSTGAIMTVGADGRFRFENVRLGSNNTPAFPYVRASATGYWDRNMAVEVRADRDGFLDLGLLRECSPASVSGLVVDAVTRQPLEGVAITGAFSARTTDVDGRFSVTDIRMQAQNTPWQQSMTATKAGYVTQSQTVNVFCGATLQVVYGPVSNNPGKVSGTVTDATTGSPLTGVFVGSDWGGSTTTDSSGRYTIDKAPPNGSPNPDDWQVTAQRSFDSTPGAVNYATASQRVTITPGATEQVDLTLARLSTPNRFPNARLATVTDPPADTPITLDASSSSDPDDDPITFDWDLDGDGQYDDATGPTATVTLGAGTTRTVAVRVTDSKLLTDVARQTIVVVAPETTSTSSTTTSSTSSTTTTSEPPATSSSTSTSTTTSSTTSTTSSSTTSTTTSSTTSTTTSTTVEPSNTPPAATIGGELEIVEGTSTVLTSTSVDADDDPLSFEWTIDGAPAGSGGSVEVFGSRYGAHIVTLIVSDGRGGSDSVDATVNVSNTSPRLVLSSAPAEIVQGVSAAVELSVFDDGVDDLTATTAEPGGATPLPLVAQQPTSGSLATGQLALPTAELGPVVIRIEACDTEPACATQIVRYTVIAASPDNGQPTVTLSAPAVVDVDATIEVVATASDPDDDPMSFAWFVDGVLQNSNADRISFPTGPAGTRTVRVEVRDGHHNEPAAASTTIAVRAVGPTLEASGPPSATVDEPWPLSLTVVDPIADTVDVTIDWGDGTSDAVSLPAMRPPVGADRPGGAALMDEHSFPHAYRSPGAYVVEVRACGSGERCAAATVPVSVAARDTVAPPPTDSPTSTASTPSPSTTTIATSTIGSTTTSSVLPLPAAPPVSPPAAAAPGPLPIPQVPTGGLPTTGSDSSRSVAVALGLLVVGLAALTAARHRRRPHA